MSLSAKIFAEFVGTYIFLTVINMTGGTTIAPIAIVGGLFAVILAFGSVSGGHFNPAVTLMKLADSGSGITLGVAATYIVAQILGGISALYGTRFMRS